jgi:hypothetical protein
MKKIIGFIILMILLFIIHEFPVHADRITLFVGDIFIGTVLAAEEQRYPIQRFGFITQYPTWWVKKIEPAINDLESPPPSAQSPLLTTLTVAGNIITVTSAPPVEAERLELYPRRSDFWIAEGRYLRGYLTNRTADAFQTIGAQLTYYDAQNHLLMQQETDIFDVYSMTMKPFIVDTLQVPWGQVKGITIQMISWVMLRP